jgi:hypothetical protein
MGTGWKKAVHEAPLLSIKCFGQGLLSQLWSEGSSFMKKGSTLAT